ncbi:MAG: hypothetical protein H7138_09655, partial [Myxococcales bacterium]|nr:hypothetical protein [Myxococcales bacterium]
VAFTVAGRDADIVTTQVSFDGGTTRTVVTPDAAGLFSLDLSSRPAGATTVTLIVTDDAGNQATKAQVVTIAAADQPPVFAAAPNDVPVLENTTAVGTFAATDADGDAVAYSLVGADAALFAISAAGVLSFRAAPDAEAPDDVGSNGIYQVTVQATAGAAVATKDLTITLTDTNELIFIDQSAFSVAEGPTAVGTITAGDEDGGPVTARFSIAGGADAAAFTLDAVTGVLSFKTERDFEAPTDVGRNNVYNVVVTARDGALSDNQAIAVTVTNVSEAPFAPFAVEAEAAALTILDTDANTNDTVVRNAANPETGTSFPGGSGLRPGFSGTGYLDFGDTPGDRATFTVTVREAGPYDLSIRYAANDARPLDLSLNGAAASTVPFVGTGLPASGATPAVEGVNRWVFLTVPVTLTAGSNTISLAIPAGRASGPNIDRIEITAAGAGPIDDSADLDANLALTGPTSAVQGAAGLVAFTVVGRDADIVTTQVSFDGGTTRASVTPDTAGVFSLDLSARPAGATTVTLIVTDDSGNEARDEQVVTIAPATPQNFNQVIEAEAFVITDTTRATALETTQARNAANPEPNPLARDVDANGLWDGFNGAGYLDMGANVGDAAAFTIDAPTAGT